MENIEETKICPKCGGRMIKGLMADSSYAITIQQCWAQSICLGGWLGTPGKRKVDAFACEQCNYLESYLQPKKK